VTLRGGKEKMLGGELYDPLDAESSAGRRRAGLRFRALDDTRDDQREERARLIRELNPHAGAWSEPPFYCDYGTNITPGARTVGGAGSVVTRDIPGGVFAAGSHPGGR
jgi:maltose O-acetyltransferase